MSFAMDALSDTPSVAERKQRSSNVVFDDYNYPTGKAAVDREMPNPKPRMRKIYTDPKALVTDPKTGKGYPAEFLEQLNRIGNRD